MMELENGQDKKDYKKMFALEISKLATILDVSLPPVRVKAYFDTLSPKMSSEQFRIACKMLGETYDGGFGQKFPLPATFLAIFKEPSAEDQFDVLYSALQSGDLIINDRKFQKLVKDQGGFYNISRWTVDDFKFNRGRLKDAYCSLARVEEKQDLLPSPKECKGLLEQFGL